MSVVIIPETLTGYLMKQGHDVRNWRKRYFVLESGRLSYYEKSSGKNEHPYGSRIKGSLSLQYVVAHLGEEKDTHDSHGNRIYLVDNSSGADLLISAADYEEAVLWNSLINKHIQFAKEYPDNIIPVAVETGHSRRWSLFTKFTPSFHPTEKAAGNVGTPDVKKKTLRRASMAGRINISPSEHTTAESKAPDNVENSPQSPIAQNLLTPHHFVPLKVDRRTGCNVVSAPSVKAKITKKIECGAYVRANGRWVDSEGVPWYHLVDGWAAATTPQGQRILRPTGRGRIIKITVIKISFSEVECFGWLGTYTRVEANFLVEVEYSDDNIDSVVRLQRSFQDLLDLESAVSRVSSKWKWSNISNSEESFPVLTDGMTELIEDPSITVQLVSSVCSSII